MELLLERCAGIDIGKDEVVACVRTPGPGGGRRKDTRTFRSFTGDLEAMADWFAVEGVTDVVMEATGSYWKPVWWILEERPFELKLVNAHHVKILPGRKSDVLDAEVAGRVAGARFAAGELRAVSGDPGAAGRDPLSQAAGPDPHVGVSADPQDP